MKKVSLSKNNYSMPTYPFPIAAPSWVIPDDARNNILFLNNKVVEIELLCFEPSLPHIVDFPETNLAYHLHLPSSVPIDFFTNKKKYIHLPAFYDENIQWKNPWILAQNLNDITFYADCCVRIFAHCKKINPWVAVMHLPPLQTPQVEEKLIHFLEYWQKHLSLDTLALENVRGASHEDFKKLLCQESYKDLRLCFDIAHAITYEQKTIMDDAQLVNKIALTHWSAPYPRISNEKIVDIQKEKCNIYQKLKRKDNIELSAKAKSYMPFLLQKTNLKEDSAQIESVKSQNRNKDMHLPLYHLESELIFCQKVMAKIPKNVTHVIEVFDWQGIKDSMTFFDALMF